MFATAGAHPEAYKIPFRVHIAGRNNVLVQIWSVNRAQFSPVYSGSAR